MRPAASSAGEKLTLFADPVSLLNEFKSFATAGTVIDLALGIVMLAAFAAQPAGLPPGMRLSELVTFPPDLPITAEKVYAGLRAGGK